MSSTASKWIAGCGIGCLVVIAIAAVLVYGGYTFVRGTIEGANEVKQSQAALDAALPSIGEFVPWPDGAVPPDRVASFLEVRSALAERRQELSGTVEHLDKVNDEGSFWSKLGSLRKGAGVSTEMFDFLAVRNDTLLQNQMGLGEYAYIYATVYYAWLGHDPEDMGGRVRNRGRASGGVIVNTDAGVEGSMVGEYRRIMIAMLRRQVQSAKLEGSLDQQGIDVIETELERLILDAERLPWQDGVPAAIAANLEPYRDELDSTYDARTQIFELLDIGSHGPYKADIEID